MTRIFILSILLVILFLLRFQHRRYEGFESSKEVVICKADWCGHCKTAAPEFEKLMSSSPITLKDGSSMTVKMLDADKDKAELSQYEVKGFPTILFMNNGKSTEYPGPRKSEDIIEYANSL